MDTQLKKEVRFLTGRLGAIIREQIGDRVFDHVEQIRHLAKAIRLRNPYIDPLNCIQIRFLPRWRRCKEQGGLVFTVNGIAFGMKSTG